MGFTAPEEPKVLIKLARHDPRLEVFEDAEAQGGDRSCGDGDGECGTYVRRVERWSRVPRLALPEALISVLVGDWVVVLRRREGRARFPLRSSGIHQSIYARRGSRGCGYAGPVQPGLDQPRFSRGDTDGAIEAADRSLFTNQDLVAAQEVRGLPAGARQTSQVSTETGPAERGLAPRRLFRILGVGRVATDQ